MAYTPLSARVLSSSTPARSLISSYDSSALAYDSAVSELDVVVPMGHLMHSLTGTHEEGGRATFPPVPSPSRDAVGGPAPYLTT